MVTSLSSNVAGSTKAIAVASSTANAEHHARASLPRVACMLELGVHCFSLPSQLRDYSSCLGIINEIDAPSARIPYAACILREESRQTPQVGPSQPNAQAFGILMEEAVFMPPQVAEFYRAPQRIGTAYALILSSAVTRN